MSEEETMKAWFVPLEFGDPPTHLNENYPSAKVRERIMAENGAKALSRRRAAVAAAMRGTIDWSSIENFIGFGNIEAPVVFIGIEEGLATVASLRKDLLWRSTFAPVMDVEIAHDGLAEGSGLFGDRGRYQPTWDVMSYLMLRFAGETFATKEEWRRERFMYRTRMLGRPWSNSLLTELLPYPNQNGAAWPYADLFPGRSECASRTSYVQSLLRTRIDRVAKSLAAHPRKAIICYGLGGWSPSGEHSSNGGWRTFKELFGDVSWAQEQGLRKYQCATWNGAKVTLAYHFSRFFKTPEELDELARVALPSGSHHG